MALFKIEVTKRIVSGNDSLSFKVKTKDVEIEIGGLSPQIMSMNGYKDFIANGIPLLVQNLSPNHKLIEEERYQTDIIGEIVTKSNLEELNELTDKLQKVISLQKELNDIIKKQYK